MYYNSDIIQVCAFEGQAINLFHILSEYFHMLKLFGSVKNCQRVSS